MRTTPAMLWWLCGRFAVLTLGIALFGAPDARGAEERVFRNGDAVVVRIPNLDRLRLVHTRLSAAIRLEGPGGEKRFDVDLSDPAVPPSIIVDTTGFGVCSRVSVQLTDAGKKLSGFVVGPVPTIDSKSRPLLPTGHNAAIEPGTASKRFGLTAPRIALPDPARTRPETLTAPTSLVTTHEITYPVVTTADLPVLGAENYVLVSRQSQAPEDATRRSLYFSYKKAVYDSESLRLKKWRKFLVEVPLQRSWLQGVGDEVIAPPRSECLVHATDETSPRGTNMLGESQDGLAQGGQSADVDDEGRTYISNLNDGAGLVRFNPKSRRFEQPPVDFALECRKFIPPDKDWKRNWDVESAHLLCLRGRVYVLFSRNYRTRTPNGNFETCSGVVSVPQEGWDDATKFRDDIRLHAGSWKGAAFRLYDSDPNPGEYTRKAGGFVQTRHGMSFVSPPDCNGGPWRLDLDDEGNTKRLAVVAGFDAVPGGGGAPPLPRTELVTFDGLKKQQMINVGASGRQFLRFNYGEFEISRGALALTLPGATEEPLVDSRGRYRTTFDGAPPGTLTIRYDLTDAIRQNAGRLGELASALSGVSLGPNYSVTPVPGEADQALAVCEYGYYLSRFDFAHRKSERKVFKEYLALLSNGQATRMPARAGLGPYNSAWAEHDGAVWLYLTGYTGMARLKYAAGGKPLPAFAPEMFHPQLRPQPGDGTPRDAIKDFLHLVPVYGGRMIDIGRGRPGRGGGPHSAGLELFDPRTLGRSQTLVAMNRCYGLFTPVSRMVLSTDGSRLRQEIFVASGEIRPEYVEDIADPARRPQNRDPKIFAFDVTPEGDLRDLFGFSLPRSPGAGDDSASLAFSPCRQYLVVLQKGGRISTWSVAERAFIDAVRLRTPAGDDVQWIGFNRPSTDVLTAPSGRLYFQTALDGAKSRSVSFFEILIDTEGRIAVRPHRGVALEGDARLAEFDGIVQCFLPDLVRKDGSCDLVLGGAQENGGPSVRVLDDFDPPR